MSGKTVKKDTVMALTADPDSPQKFRRSVRLVIIRRGDIYYADLRPVVGSEQGGVRPVLIIQNDVGNRHSPTVICAAITSRMNKAKLPTHVELSAAKSDMVKDSVILLEQLRTIDKQRLKERICHIDNELLHSSALTKTGKSSKIRNV
mgnify:CR=1 FL=1